MKIDLTGKIALVTGASRGIGKAIADALQGAGATTLRWSSKELDLSKRGELPVGWNHAPIDILVNNAATLRYNPTFEDWDADLELMLTSPMHLSQLVLAGMIERGGGKIVNTCSISSFQGARNLRSYIAAKHGLLGLTKALAVEWAQFNIQVNAVAPGFIDTDMLKQVNVDVKRIPAGRVGKPDEVAGVVLFLCSSHADYITGACIPVDGGWLAR